MTRWPLPEPMALALDEARAAAEAGEVPVGAAIVLEGKVIATAHNSPRALNDPSAHAEMRFGRQRGFSATNGWINANCG